MMEPFQAINLVDGDIAYDGTASNGNEILNEIGLEVFWIKLRKKRRLYGAFYLKFENDWFFSISIYEFGFSDRRLVGNTDHEYMAILNENEIRSVKNIINEFFVGENVRKRLYFFDLKKSSFNGNVDFDDGWLRSI